MPGGGGYGDPAPARSRQGCARDVASGLVSEDVARDVYGVVLTADLAVDEAATAKARMATAAGNSSPSPSGVARRAGGKPHARPMKFRRRVALKSRLRAFPSARMTGHFCPIRGRGLIAVTIQGRGGFSQQHRGGARGRRQSAAPGGWRRHRRRLSSRQPQLRPSRHGTSAACASSFAGML